MKQTHAGTELNWMALELVVNYTRHDKDLCRAASRACDALRNKDFAPPEKRIAIIGNLEKEVVSCKQQR